MSLDKRPALHNSTLMLLINLSLLVICWFLASSKIGYKTQRTAAVLLCYMFAVSWTTHHLRDASRRGLWIAPFGHTAPLPKWLYLATTTAVPFIVRTLLSDVAYTGAAAQSQNLYVWSRLPSFLLMREIYWMFIFLHCHRNKKYFKLELGRYVEISLIYHQCQHYRYCSDISILDITFSV